MSKIDIDEENIEIFENFIVNNKPINEICISPKDKMTQELALKNIKNDKQNTLYLFGGSGFRSYYFYKSTTNIIFLFETYLNKIDSYSLFN